jgi:cyclohexadienyl dehydratase
MKRKVSFFGGIGFFILFISTFGCNPSIKNLKNNTASVAWQTNSILDKVKSNGIIRVGTTGDFMPFSYQLNPSENTYHGVDIELAKDLAKSLGVKVEFVKTSWPTMMQDLQEGKFDLCMSGVTIKLVRQEKALFSIPLLASGKAVITRDENAATFISIESINQSGVKVIVNPGGTNEAFAKTNFPEATIIENEDNLSIFQKIVDGEADLMVTDAVETLIQEQIHPELEAVNPDQPFNFFEMGYLLPRDHTFKAYIDQWLNLRKKDGTYQRIFDEELAAIKK